MSFEERIVRELSRLRTFLIFVGVMGVIAVALAAWGFAQAQTAQSAVASQALAARSLATALVTVRAQTIFRDCQEVNARHLGTVRVLNQQLDVYLRHATPAQRKQILASKHFTVLLIDKLAPLTNCYSLVIKDSPQGVHIPALALTHP